MRAVVLVCGLPAALVTWALWLAAGLGHLGQYAWVFDLFANFTAQYLALFAACVVALTIARWRKTALVALLGVAFTTATMGPYFQARATTLTAEQGRLRLVTFNVWYRNQDTRRVAEFLRASGADLVVLQEVDTAKLDALARQLPGFAYRATTPRSPRHGLAIFSRWPMTVEHLNLPMGLTRISRADVNWRGTQLVLFGTHLSWPLGRRTSAARALELDALAAAAGAISEPALVAGDFNLTPWSRFFERFVDRSGLRDCAIGQGLLATWPAQFMPVRIRIDHCFASEHWRVQRVQVGPNLGSDHLPVIVDLALRPRSEADAE